MCGKKPSKRLSRAPTVYFERADGLRVPYSFLGYIFGGTSMNYGDDNIESEDIQKGNAKKKSGTVGGPISAAQAIRNILRQAI